jgi:hypothetical protein
VGGALRGGHTVKRLALALTLAVLVAGCGAPPSGKTLEPAPPFRGKPAPKRIDFDLAGTWRVMRFGTPEDSGKLPPWSAQWRLEKRGPALWVDGDGQGAFSLMRIEDWEVLRWLRPNGARLYLFVNEWSFGSLTMTGDDRERYHAVRTEGGEGLKPTRHLGGQP